MNTKIVVITLKSIYGTIKAYPRNDSAILFATIAGTKTLTIDTLKQITLLGYSIECLNGGCDITINDLTS